jgi:hypothetical protein
MQTATDKRFPSFPKNVIQGLAKEFVDLYLPTREVLPQALWLSFCVYLGALVSPFVKLDAMSSEPRLYGAVVGRSARTRKSTANNTAKEVFARAFPESEEQKGRIHIVTGFGSSEGLLSELGNYPKIPTVLYLDEVNILAQKTSGDGTIGISAFNKLFEDHDYIHPLASGKGPRVRDAYLSVVGASTIEDFTQMWKGKHAAAGFFSRLLLVGVDESDKRIAIPTNPPAVEIDALVTKLRELYEEVQARPKQYALTPEAQDKWKGFYESFGDGDEWNRLDTYGLRLMSLQTLLEGEDEVTTAVVEKVIEVLNYEVAVRIELCPVVAENTLAAVQQQVCTVLTRSGRTSKRELERAINYQRYGTKVVGDAIDGLVKDNRVRAIKAPRNKIIYELIEDEPEDFVDAVSIEEVTSENDDTLGTPKSMFIQQLALVAGDLTSI